MKPEDIIKETINKIGIDKSVHRIKIEVDFVNFQYISQELIKPNRIREIEKDEPKR